MAVPPRVAVQRRGRGGGRGAGGHPEPVGPRASTHARHSPLGWEWVCEFFPFCGCGPLGSPWPRPRANHSCRPNVFRAELSPHVVALVALTRIQPGEEICLSYLSDMKLLQPNPTPPTALGLMFVTPPPDIKSPSFIFARNFKTCRGV